MSGRHEKSLSHKKSPSYNHAIRFLGPEDYRLAWTVDHYRSRDRLRYHRSGGHLRYPTEYSRIADRDGATRFAKKWGISMPEMPERKI